LQWLRAALICQIYEFRELSKAEEGLATGSVTDGRGTQARVTQRKCGGWERRHADAIIAFMAEQKEKKVKELALLEDFESAVGSPDKGQAVQNAGLLHCPTCGDSRRMHLVAHHKTGTWTEPPILATLHCVQCDTLFTAVLYRSPEGKGLAILPSTYGGLTTPHTPKGVAYYLDQAQRSQSVGANSAAVAMFRAALDHLLFEQGFKKGMCGQKLAELESAVKANTAPKWAYELDAEFLIVMKNLGDGAIHPNDGNVADQSKLDNELLAKITHTFQMLLFLIYELPHQKQKRLDALKAGIIKK
jgi:hypothetical protein